MQEFTVEKKENALIVHCEGPITFDRTPELKALVDKAMDGGDFRHLVADLSGVTFMDSSGIGALVALNSRVYSTQRRLYLYAPTPQVHKILELVKLSNFFEFLSGPEDLELLLSE
ncbi:MAG: STAS domain-containing protein [Desulfovibrionaceae bacterium]